MSAINIKDYIDYFRQLAVKHKDLQHDPTSEDGDSAPKKKRFTRWSVDEVVTGLRSKMGFPAMLLELYEVNTSFETVYDVRANYAGALTIIAHATKGKTSEEVEAFFVSEKILREVLQQIWQDHYGDDHERCTTPFTDFYFNINIIPVGPLFDNEFGMRAEFGFKPRSGFDITTKPAEGTFIQ